jgi:lipopolysaccharide export system protein LptA
MSLPCKSLLGLLLALALAPALAAPSAKKSPTDALRPTGPVTVTADRAEWSKGGAMIYTGKVSLDSDKLKMSGDRLELTQLPSNQYTAKITGALAHLEHAGELDDKGQPTPTVTADASTLLYDSRTSVVDIMGSARMTRGKDEVTGNTIRYNVAERRIQAAGGEGGQVKIVIQPPPDKKMPAPKSLEPAPNPAPADQKPAEQKPADPKT